MSTRGLSRESLLIFGLFLLARLEKITRLEDLSGLLGSGNPRPAILGVRLHRGETTDHGIPSNVHHFVRIQVPADPLEHVCQVICSHRHDGLLPLLLLLGQFPGHISVPESTNVRKGQPFTEYFLEITRNINAAINFIKECFDSGFNAARSAPDKVYTLVYEKLVRNPEDETKKLCAFLGIEWSREMLSPADKEHFGESAITVNSNEIWYDASTYYSNPNTQSLDKWIKILSASQQVRVCEAFQADSELKKLGYDLSVSGLKKPVRFKGGIGNSLLKIRHGLLRKTICAFKGRL